MRNDVGSRKIVRQLKCVGRLDGELTTEIMESLMLLGYGGQASGKRGGGGKE
jgi:hypothetical protein